MNTKPANKTNCQLAIEAKIFSLTQLRLLEVLAAEGNVGMTHAASRIGLSTAATTGTVDALESTHHMVRRVRLVHDRRAISIELTDTGKAFAKTLTLPAEEPAFA